MTAPTLVVVLAVLSAWVHHPSFRGFADYMMTGSSGPGSRRSSIVTRTRAEVDATRFTP